MTRRFLAASALVLLLGILVPGANAQQTDAPRASARLMQGDVLETMAVTGDENPEYGWVLTKDGELIEAGREKIFRTRLTDAGTYVLDGNARIASGDKRVIMTIIVTPFEEGQNDDNAPQQLDVVSTNPPVLSGTLPITADEPVVSLTPAPFVSGAITLDLDSMTDSDGDGVPNNDNDAGDTLFADEHNALHLWYLDPKEAQALYLSAQTEDGTPLLQRIELAGGTDTVPTGDILTSSAGPGVIRFELPLQSTVPQENVVIEWNFGDGRKSLVDEPEHRYAYDGTYDVKAIVRELQTGRVLLEASMSVPVTGTTGPTNTSSSSSSSSRSASSAPSTQEPSTGTSSTVITIIRILFFGAIAIAIGIGAVWAFKKFMNRESSLQKTLEEAEKKLLGKEGDESDAPPPMELKRSKPADAPEATPAPEAPAAEQKTEEVAPPAPAPQTEAPAPAWLQKGLDVAAETGQTPTNPPPPAIEPPVTPLPVEQSAAAPEPVPTPAPAPSPIQELPAQPAAQEIADALPEAELLPPWLQEANEQPVADAVAPAAAVEPPVTALPVEPTPPAPQAAPAPAPIAEPTPAPVPAPIVEPIPAPVVEPTPIPEPAPVAPVVPTPVIEPAPVPTPAPIAEPAPAPAPIVEPTPVPAPAPIPEPIPAPVPVPEPIAPAPVVAAPVPAPVTPTPAVPATQTPAAPAPLSPEAQARLDREREKKRKKRQRYRENLKKRKVEEKSVTSPVAAPVPTPKPNPAPIVESAPASAPIAPPAPKPTPAPKPVEKKPASKPKPVPQDIPPATADDSVAFLVRADSVEKQQKEKKEKKKKDSPPQQS
jgi:hypothetical protein